MDCRDAQPVFDLLLDGEESHEQRRSVLAHLEDCPTCREEFAYRRLLKRAIGTGGTGVEVPPHLWDAIRAGLDDLDRTRGPGGRGSTRRTLLAGLGAMAALLMAAIGVLLSPWPLRPSGSSFMVESANNYIRYLLPHAPYDLQTDEPDRIRQWFQERVDFVVEAPDLRPEGFQLLGARLGYFLDRIVAEVGYQRDGRRLSLFMARGDGVRGISGERFAVGDKEFFIGTSKGYTIVAWREAQGNIVCSVVADLAREQLLPVVFKVAGIQS